MDDASKGNSKRKPPLFWWTLANILAIAFAITSWTACLTLFRDPTHPTSYYYMKKFGRLDELEAFTARSAPKPDFERSATELEKEFQSYSEEDRKTLNRELKRSYLTNYSKTKILTYVTGEFQVLEVRKLGEEDFLHPGIVVKTQALIKTEAISEPVLYPVFLEYMIPSNDISVESFPVGSTLMLEKQPHCAALLNVGTKKHDDRDVLHVTVVPLAAIEYTTELEKKFTVSPPPKVNVSASLPALP